jgi:hypothetical protein
MEWSRRSAVMGPVNVVNSDDGPDPTRLCLTPATATSCMSMMDWIEFNTTSIGVP